MYDFDSSFPFSITCLQIFFIRQRKECVENADFYIYAIASCFNHNSKKKDFCYNTESEW